MDEQTQGVVTKALDTAIASVAAEWFVKLSSGLTDKEITRRVHNSLRSLEKLQRGEMPQYDAWDALFYALWYQPSQINLAYTIARNIPDRLNPLRNGIGSIRVFDFGCGALAMKFGLVLAAFEFLQRSLPYPKIFFGKCDSSDSMIQIGMDIWNNFGNNVEIKRLKRRLTAPASCKSQGEIRWLTALHVAYQENFDAVRQSLDDQVKSQKPDLILATTHKVSEGCLYCPNLSVYERNERLSSDIEASDLIFKGSLDKTTLFRKNLWHTKIDAFDNRLSNEERSFVKNYLTSLNTTWTAATSTKQYSAACRAYVRS